MYMYMYIHVHVHVYTCMYPHDCFVFRSETVSVYNQKLFSFLYTFKTFLYTLQLHVEQPFDNFLLVYMYMYVLYMYSLTD